MEHLVPVLVFYLLVLTLCLARPGAGRIFVGIFFLIMAIGINVVLVFVAPELFVGIGTDAPLIPLYRWFALMMLSKGRYAKWGIIGGIVFLIGITPLGVWTLANLIMALALALLLRKEYDGSLPEMLRSGLRPT